MKRLFGSATRIVGAAAAVLGVVVVVLLVFALRTVCGNDFVREYASPDGGKKVVVFQRSCGATTGFSTQASLLEAKAAFPWRAGNLFAADIGNGGAPAAPWGGPDLQVLWEGPNKVALRRDPRARVWFCESQVLGVEVRCSP